MRRLLWLGAIWGARRPWMGVVSTFRPSCTPYGSRLIDDQIGHSASKWRSRIRTQDSELVPQPRLPVLLLDLSHPSLKSCVLRGVNRPVPEFWGPAGLRVSSSYPPYHLAFPASAQFVHLFIWGHDNFAQLSLGRNKEVLVTGPCTR